MLIDSAFFGGAGDQRATGLSVNAGSVYVSGDAPPEGVPSSSALVLSYPIGSPLSASWQRSFDFGTSFYGIAASGDGIYTAGSSYALSTDQVGDKESKSIAAKFASDGSDGPGAGGSIWETTPNCFVYSGVETHLAETTATENGNTVVYATGYGQPNGVSNAYVVAKYDVSGHLIASATDSSAGIAFNSFNGNGNSAANTVAVVGGDVYLAGFTDWASDGDSGAQPAIWKYDPSLNQLWRLKDTADHGAF